MLKKSSDKSVRTVSICLPEIWHVIGVSILEFRRKTLNLRWRRWGTTSKLLGKN